MLPPINIFGIVIYYLKKFSLILNAVHWFFDDTTPGMAEIGTRVGDPQGPQRLPVVLSANKMWGR